MYLSRLSLDPAKRQVQAEIANRYQLHRTLLAQFASNTRNDIGLLYRLEVDDQYEFKPIILLVQSQVEPTWDQLQLKGLLWQPAEVKTFNVRVDDGEQFYFRLLANPTLRRAKGEWAGKRVEIRAFADQKAWLERKGYDNGFTILSLNLIDKGKLISQKFENEQKHSIQHQAVLFEGLLEVSNSELIRKAIIQGIGSAKGFGFGLLSLVRYQ